MLQRQMTELLRIAKALGLGLFSLPAMQRNQLTGKTCLWNDLLGCYVPSGMLKYTHSSPVSIQMQSLALRTLRLDGNRAKRKRLHWQAANHGCHCIDRASYWLQAAANRMLGRSSGNQLPISLATFLPKKIIKIGSRKKVIAKIKMV